MYQWRSENNVLEAGVGESPIVHFTVESEPPLAEDAQHTLTKHGEAVKRKIVDESYGEKCKKMRLGDSGSHSTGKFSHSSFSKINCLSFLFCFMILLFL